LGCKVSIQPLAACHRNPQRRYRWKNGTERDPGWTPLNATPLHPEYPSQAAIFAGVSTGVFRAVFGEEPGPRLVVVDSADPKLSRPFESLAAMTEETRLVRIWGGIHFRSSLEASDVMGRQLAESLVANSIRRVR
jgi:hypothetical protein